MPILAKIKKEWLKMISELVSGSIPSKNYVPRKSKTHTIRNGGST
jgi:hypothetical protein